MISKLAIWVGVVAMATTLRASPWESSLEKAGQALERLKEVVGGLLPSPPAVPKAIVLPKIPIVKLDPKDATQIGQVDDRLVNKFYQGLTRVQKTDLAVGFTNELYHVILGRLPTAKELRGRVNALLQGGSREGVYHSLVLGGEYHRHERQKNQLNNPVQQFVLNYLATYVNLQIAPQQLGPSNFHQIKRMVVEKSLEVIDAFSSRSDISAWFAVFSMALENQGRWQQKHRQLKTDRRYLQWAERVPVDILKSEVMIKLHRTMNSLQ